MKLCPDLSLACGLGPGAAQNSGAAAARACTAGAPGAWRSDREADSGSLCTTTAPRRNCAAGGHVVRSYGSSQVKGARSQRAAAAASLFQALACSSKLASTQSLEVRARSACPQQGGSPGSWHCCRQARSSRAAAEVIASSGWPPRSPPRASLSPWCS
eukprot:CAMPEP_0206268840 /NCGR_PEP_ID=MMETSP0047_2-20121206/31947_1 /ASSEMBLY_ACC=CAM_ASM_000192 /TAXON_ID=195065 /ORGANISM="Chroomonas mesostigmatica_cf, Strain CCMP1168" /LENGTH=157 /DNA_ID=CAMNT_0053697237 /DNA_START=253 /DNA_END=724 /DNA_ORIENTATION=+